MTDAARTARPPLTVVIAWPRILFCVMAGIIVAGLVRYIRRGDDALDVVGAALLAGYLAWILVEVPVTFRRAAAAPAESGTLLAYALARIGVVGGGALGPVTWHSWSPWLAAPALVFVVGVTTRQVAIRTLGRFYSHHVMRQDGHQIVTGGLYRLIRHPAYAGMLLANLGFTIYFLNPFSVVAMVLLGAAVVWRMLKEERVLSEIPGYPGYAAGKARLVPGLW